MKEWRRAKIAWDRVVADIETARDEIGCSATNAWFRGQRSSRFQRLLPFIHRIQDKLEPSVVSDISLRRDRFVGELWMRKDLNGDKNRILEVLSFETGLVEQLLPHRVSVDQANYIYDRIVSHVNIWLEHGRKAKALRSLSNLDSRLRTLELRESNLPAVRELVRDLTARGVNFRLDDFESLKSSLATFSLQDRLSGTKAELGEMKRRMHRDIDEATRMGATCLGEQDAFNDFKFRNGDVQHTSWETLALMQHYDVPTRMLDWSESLAVALQFALSGYFVALKRNWFSNGMLKEHGFGKLPFSIPDLTVVGHPDHPKDAVIEALKPRAPDQCPVVWIMNPYKLAQGATGRSTIIEVTSDRRMDYYDCFFGSTGWPYSKAIPIYSPWRNPRLAAQQGHFTVHGLDRLPLNDQVKGDVIRQVRIPANAAVYGTRLLMGMIGSDRFTMFRDLDSLGADVREKFSLE